MPNYVEEFAERNRGILTENQRKHLLGMLDEDPSDKADAIRMREHRIRRNVRNSMLDFVLLAQVNDENVAQVFSDLPRIVNIDEFIPYTDRELCDSLEAVFEFLYLTLGTYDPDRVSPFMWFFHLGVGSALKRLYAEQGYYVEPDIVMRATPETAVPLEKIREDFDQGKYITRGEAESLFRGGEMEYDQYKEYTPGGEDDSLSERDIERKEYLEEIAIDPEEITID